MDSTNNLYILKKLEWWVYVFPITLVRISPFPGKFKTDWTIFRVKESIHLITYTHLWARGLHGKVAEAAHDALLDLQAEHLQRAYCGQQHPGVCRAADLDPRAPVAPLLDVELHVPTHTHMDQQITLAASSSIRYCVLCPTVLS